MYHSLIKGLAVIPVLDQRPLLPLTWPEKMRFYSKEEKFK